MTKHLPSTELLRKLLRYEPDTGKLFWRERSADMFLCKVADSASIAASWNLQNAEKEAFTTTLNGYKKGKIFDKTYKAHRIAWAIYYGAHPVGLLDHINRKRDDNRIENLRIVTNSQSGANRSPAQKSSSRYLGVTWHKRDKAWQASIEHMGKVRFLGYHKTEDGAARAYDKAALELFGEFANPNF